MASPQPQSNVVQTTPQPLMHQRSVARKPVGKPAGAPSQSISLPHRPAPQQQHPQAGYPPHNQQQQQHVQQQRPQSYHPGQQVQPVYHQQSPQQIHQAQPIAHPGQPIQHQQAQPAQYPPQQQQQHSQPHPQPPYLHQQPIQYPQNHQQAPQQQYQQQQQLPQQHVQAQHPQQQPFSPTNPSPNPAPQTTLPNTHQAQPQQSPASPTPQIHRVDTANSNIGSFVADHGRPGSISGSSAGIATPATTVATPSVAGTPRWEPNVVSAAVQQPPVSQQTPAVQHVPAQQSPAIHHAPGAQQPQPAQYAPTAQQIPAIQQNHPPQHTPAIQPTPAVQATPAADLRRTSTGQPQLCNHCRKGIPLNVSVYTCLICSTAHITTNFCVWCFTSNAVNTSHSHDKSYYATESDPRVQSSVQDATTQMWTIRKNVSGRLWYTHNSTGLKTHLKPTAAALFGFSGLPPGWDERKTPDGRTFYFNKRLGTSSWVKPANSLPDGWRELRTPDMTPFYINEQLGLSTWDRPGQQPRQTKQGNKVIVRKARPGQPNQPQNVGDSILSATVNAARLTGQGVEMASRQVGKLGKKKNWRKMGRMLNTVNSFGGIGSGSDGEYDDSYNDDGDFGFGGDDSSGFQDQQQGQFQQSFDYQQSSFSQPQQSFSFEDNQQSMFQQPAFEQQSTFEYSVQTEQPAFEQPGFDQQPAFGQQPEQFSVTTEVSYTINDCQPAFEQEVQYTQTYEQQPGFEVQQQTTFEATSTQEPILAQQTTSYETVITSEQVGVEPPIQLTEQPVYQVTSQETYPTQPYVYDPTQMPQQQVTISYSVPDYAAEPAPLFTTQTQVQQPMYPVFLQNNQPEIITSDIPLVEVPSTPENTTLILNSGYSSNDILAGTSLAVDNNTAPISQVSTPAPQDSIVVEVTVQSTPTPGLERSASPAPLVVQECDASAKPASIVTVDPVQPVDYDVGARCNALI
ncbi:related to tpa inducible protein [Fusarium oxysporum]|uniref:Related to tpa inducible protein n=1 Tax=Fusarium oxysporum TaxID=5507 RepID=A0A2H3T0C7_FUSOX|nr:related to tpa inducible protein [Fusarium oxysporum]